MANGGTIHKIALATGCVGLTHDALSGCHWTGPIYVASNETLYDIG